MKRLIEYPDFGYFSGRSKWSSFLGEIVKETNKAYLVSFWFEFEEGETPIKSNPIWLPKTLCFIEKSENNQISKIRAISLMVKSNIFGKQHVENLKQKIITAGGMTKIHFSVVPRR